MNAAEFLAWEREQLEKHEWLDGEIVARQSSSFRHGALVSALIGDVPSTEGNRGTDLRTEHPAKDGDLGVEPQTIFYEPYDDRFHVTTHWDYPHRATGRWANTGCTGFFLGPRTVFTAAHCFYDRPSATWINSGNFVPGKNTTSPTEPWGQWNTVTWYVPTAFAQQGTYSSGVDWDFAVIDVNIPQGWTGSPGWYGVTTSILSGATIYGYPQDKGNLQMWGKGGPRTGTAGQRWLHKVDIVGAIVGGRS